MSFQEQLVNLYLSNLNKSTTDSEMYCDPKDPTVYNSLFQLHKYYVSIGRVPSEHREYLLSVFKNFLDEHYSDFLVDNETEGNDPVSFEEFLEFWKCTDFEDDYGGNGSYNIYLMTINTLKMIYRLMV